MLVNVKLEIKGHAYEDYILRINATLDWLIFKGKAKTKLSLLVFLHCGEIVKIVTMLVLLSTLSSHIFAVFVFIYIN